MDSHTATYVVRVQILYSNSTSFEPMFCCIRNLSFRRNRERDLFPFRDLKLNFNFDLFKNVIAGFPCCSFRPYLRRDVSTVSLKMNGEISSIDYLTRR